MGAPEVRYRQLAEALLAAPDPVVAVAHELGDQAGRLDALSDRLRSVEATVNAEQARRANAGWQGRTRGG